VQSPAFAQSGSNTNERPALLPCSLPIYKLGSSYTERKVLGRLCASLEANSPACPMPSIVVEPVVGIFPSGKPLVADEGFRVSEESLSPTASVGLAR
jgi:hypothetical protein